ncbi:MAG: ubiquinol-cytochrome c reductase iron-sulfur subunit, partial [Vicinamibacterales bacterium]
WKVAVADETITTPPDRSPADQQPAWRQDFPIDWPQDQYVERRDFVKFLTLTSFAFVVGQMWIAGKSWLRQRTPPAEARRIASRRDLAVGGSLVFEYPVEHDTCLLVRVADDEFVAFSQTCTHLSCAVIPRPHEGVFHCPCHEGIFDLRTGSVIAGPPPRPLPRIVLEMRGDDIYAIGVDTRTV